MCLPAGTSDLAAQGVTTATIRGSVVAADGGNVDGTRVRVTNTATGYVVETQVRAGGFLVQGLEVGDVLVVSLEHLGFWPQERRAIVLRLGELLELPFVMQPRALALDTLTATSDARARSNTHGGMGVTISDSLIHRLPTPNRNVYDFVSLAPQISTRVGRQRTGVAAAGSNMRFNNFLIDGAEERFVNGNVSAAFNIGKSIPLDAVKEYQVLIAPYDVRYGDFAGGLINTVTAAGSNEWRGSAFASWRKDRLTRDSSTGTRYERLQYGLALGGPIVRNRAHFFIASEFQHLTSQSAGPFLGQALDSMQPLPVRAADIARFQDIMSRKYGLQSGSAGFVELSDPLRSLFGRVDAAIPAWRSRASAFVTYSSADDQSFARDDKRVFALSSYAQRNVTGLRMASLRLHTQVGAAGGHNQLLVSHSADWGNVVPAVRQPLVRVFVPGTTTDVVTLLAGSAEQAHGRSGRGWSLSIRDDLSLPLGAQHVLGLGVHAQRFQTRRAGVVGGYGVWTFASLDAFEQGVAGRYELRKSLGSASTTLRGAQYAAWLGDEWRPADRIALTFGMRADVLDIASRGRYNADVDSIFGRRTDRMPAPRIHLSPRFSFTWDLSASGRDRLRGGAGMFTGRPPLAWFVPAVSSYGIGIGVLRCGLSPTDAGPPPSFVADYRQAPTACATGQSLLATPRGDVDLLASKLRPAQTLRASLSYDRQLFDDVLVTTEILISRSVSDFVFVNMNLQGPQAVDAFGRVLYGTIGANAAAAPALRSDFAEVIDLRNTSRNYSYQLSARAEKRFSDGIAGVASYTYSRVRDVQSPSRVNLPGIALWADARALSGRHDDDGTGVSLNDLPHRLVAAVTYAAPWRRAPTEVSFYYVGESGSPLTYLAYGSDRRGDLNADGSNANDPIYVPRDVFAADEMLFSGNADEVRAQQEALSDIIQGSACLRRQRGRIMERNSCREPHTHTTVAALRQALPIGRRTLDAGLGLFNVLNLLNRRWGLHRVGQPQLLEHVGQTAGAAGRTQPIFRFSTTRAHWTTLDAESAYQLQVTVHYRF